VQIEATIRLLVVRAAEHVEQLGQRRAIAALSRLDDLVDEVVARHVAGATAAGLDRADQFRRAEGSASELTTALRCARGATSRAPSSPPSTGAGSGSRHAMAAHPRWRLTH